MRRVFDTVAVIADALREYLRLDRYIGALLVVCAILYVPTIPRATNDAVLLATATNDDPWMAMALDATMARPFGNPANYFNPRMEAHKSIPQYWHKLRYDGIFYYGGAIFMLATPVYAVARLAGLPPFPTGPIILRFLSVLGGMLSLIVLYNFARRYDMRWAGLLATVYLVADAQFGQWMRMAHPDTFQVFFALLALVVGLRHADRGDLPSLFALGMFCGFVHGAKAGGPWTVPMGLVALAWGFQAAGYRWLEWRPAVRRVALLGGGALLGTFISSPYGFLDSYFIKISRGVWRIQGLGASADGPFGRITPWTWIEAIYTYIGPVAAALVMLALVRIVIALFRRPMERAVVLTAVLCLSQFVWYAVFGRYWIHIGYLVLAVGLMALVAFDSAIGLLRKSLQLAMPSAGGQRLASRIAVVSVVSVAVLLGTQRVLHSSTSMLLLVSFQDSTQVAVNEWAVRAGLPKTTRIVYDDAAYLDPARFPNAISHPKPTWGVIDSAAADYLVLSSSIYGSPHYQALIKSQKLNRDDPVDFATGGYSVRLYQDLLHFEAFGKTDLPGVDYVAEIKGIPVQHRYPSWSRARSPYINWALESVWWSEYWLRYSMAVIRSLTASDTPPMQGPTFRVYRIGKTSDGQRVRYARSCDEGENHCTDFKRRLADGEPMTVAFDRCTNDIRIVTCGNTYVIKYWKDGNSWCSSISSQPGSKHRVDDVRECKGDPEDGTISLFSLAFVFNGKGEVHQLIAGRPPLLVGQLKRTR